MEIRDPNLKAFIDELNSNHQKNFKTLDDKIETISLKVDEAVYIDMPNGDGNRMKLSKVLPTIYKDVKQLKETTEFLSDFQRLHRILKKYKLYYFIALILMIVFGVGIRDIIVDALKGM